MADGEDIKIVGIVQPAEGSKATALNMGIGYPYSLMTHVAEEAKNSEIVKQQKPVRISMYLPERNSVKIPEIMVWI